jgi:hypothetical protein
MVMYVRENMLSVLLCLRDRNGDMLRTAGICGVVFRAGLEETDEFLSVPRLPGQLFHLS